MKFLKTVSKINLHKPVRVGINIHVASMDDISEVNMDYTVTVYFMQTWHDPRLILDPDGKYGPKGWLSNCSITLATSIGEDIWVSTRKDYHGTILWYRLWYKVYTVKRLVYTAYLFRIKTPDVFFINEKVSFKHTVTMKNAMFRLLPDGNVIYSVKDPMLKTDNMLFMIRRLINPF